MWHLTTAPGTLLQKLAAIRKTVGQQHGGASLEEKLATDTVLRVNVYGPMHLLSFT